MLTYEEQFFFSAVDKEDIDQLLILLKTNVTLVNVKDTNGITALHKATIRGNINVMNLLLEHGADIEAKTLSGFSSIHLAALEGLNNIIELLGHNNSSNLKALTTDGRNAAHLAAERGHIDTIDFLFSLGLDIQHRDNLGNNILHYARFKPNTLKHIILKYFPNTNISDPIYSGKEVTHKKLSRIEHKTLSKNYQVSSSIDNYLKQESEHGLFVINDQDNSSNTFFNNIKKYSKEEIEADRARHWKTVLIKPKLDSNSWTHNMKQSKLGTVANSKI